MSVTVATLYWLRWDPNEEQWFLDAPRDPAGRVVDSRIFTHGKPYAEMDEIKRAYLEAFDLSELPRTETLTVPIYQAGEPRRFNFAGLDMFVVTRAIGELVGRMAPGDVERLPVRVEGRDEPYEILNVISTVDCIDHEHTVAERWPEGSERAGEYRMVAKLVLDETSVPADTRIFQVKGWEVVVAVTEDLKNALQDLPGVAFQPLSGPEALDYDPFA